MTNDRENKIGHGSEDDSMSWFGAFAGGGLLATMVTLFAGFIWWSVALLMEIAPPQLYVGSSRGAVRSFVG